MNQVLPKGMLRQNIGKGGVGGSWYMRLRIVHDPRCVAEVFELGLGTRNKEEAQTRAVNLLNALDVLGIRYHFSLRTEAGSRIEYNDIRSWRRNLRKRSRSKSGITPAKAPCQPLLPGLDSSCKHE